ncbi:chromosome transmission fidelity protein 8 homolog isoform X2 [Haliotis rubra]|uniref:chromosome transmission fidelity protein 8 homolog isoform X2 n=1 Tax=Haliotis rubra TaxID=36100 RepID=UPI001EE57597|nr:chromosome transmission fidelity protein 8 homolog isoform X2 [Haliotis rubra]
MVQVYIQLPGGAKDCPEWAIIDLQGVLETRHPVPLGGKFIGDLHFTKKDAPVLIIGHHILYGKVVDLEKPFAVLAKQSQTQGDVAMETNQTNNGYVVEAIIKKKILFKTRPKPIISHVPKKL